MPEAKQHALIVEMIKNCFMFVSVETLSRSPGSSLIAGRRSDQGNKESPGRPRADIRGSRLAYPADSQSAIDRECLLTGVKESQSARISTIPVASTRRSHPGFSRRR